MAFNNIATRLAALAAEVIEERTAFTLSLGTDAIALVSRRVQGKGTKSTGEQFKVPYSKQYEKYRKAKGLPINKRNLTDTGRMFASIKPEVTSNDTNVTEVTIKSSKEQQEKVEANSKRERINILELSKKEREFINGRTSKWIESIQEKYI